MIIDKNMTLAEAVSAAAAAGTALVGDVMDLDTAGRHIGPDLPLFLVIQVTTAFASGGSAEVEFVLASDAAAAIDTGGAATEHVSSGQIPFATLAANKAVILQMPGGVVEAERYMGLLVKTSGATTTAGSINAFFTTDAQAWKAFADAVN